MRLIVIALSRPSSFPSSSFFAPADDWSAALDSGLQPWNRPAWPLLPLSTTGLPNRSPHLLPAYPPLGRRPPLRVALPLRVDSGAHLAWYQALWGRSRPAPKRPMSLPPAPLRGPLAR